MQKWEHMSLVQLWSDDAQHFYWKDDEADERSAIDRLNELGNEGWALVTVDRGYLQSDYGRQFFLRRLRE